MKRPEAANWDKRKQERMWSAFMWAVIGFAAGTLVIAPLVLSTDPRQQISVGMVVGGLPAGLCGLLYGRRRVRQQN